MISRATFFWQPIASMVTMQPLNSSTRSNSGTAVISLLLSATFHCPSTSPLPSAQALTIYLTLWSPFNARRSALPSRATTSCATASRTLCVQPRKQSKKCSGLSAAKTRLKVSWEGIPPRSFRNVWNQSRLALPKSSMSLNVSAAHKSAQTAITRMSTRSWSLLRLMRGSGTRARCATRACCCQLVCCYRRMLLHPSLFKHMYKKVQCHFVTLRLYLPNNLYASALMAKLAAQEGDLFHARKVHPLGGRGLRTQNPDFQPAFVDLTRARQLCRGLPRGGNPPAER